MEKRLDMKAILEVTTEGYLDFVTSTALMSWNCLMMVLFVDGAIALHFNKLHIKQRMKSVQYFD